MRCNSPLPLSVLGKRGIYFPPDGLVSEDIAVTTLCVSQRSSGVCYSEKQMLSRDLNVMVIHEKHKLGLTRNIWTKGCRKTFLRHLER